MVEGLDPRRFGGCSGCGDGATAKPCFGLRGNGTARGRVAQRRSPTGISQESWRWGLRRGEADGGDGDGDDGEAGGGGCGHGEAKRRSAASANISEVRPRGFLGKLDPSGVACIALQPADSHSVLASINCGGWA
jgi:hypothetical protein